MSRSAIRHLRVLPSLLLPNNNTYDNLILGDGPEAYWRFDGTSSGLVDRTGHGHHARGINNPVSNFPFLDGLGACAFNGINQYIEIPNSPALSVPKTGVLTIGVWKSPGTLTFTDPQGRGGPNGGDYVHWFGKSVAGQSEYVGRMYQLVPQAEPNRSSRISGYAFNLAATPSNPTNLGAGSFFQDVYPDPDTTRVWIYYTLVINTINTSATYPTGYIKIYKNGELRDIDRLADYSIIPTHGTSPLRFGTSSLDSFFKGSITRAALYPYELSPVQIRTHYRAMVPPPVGVGSYSRNVGTLTTATSGNKLQMTLTTGVPAGATLLARVGHAYTAAGPTMQDSRGNVWTRDRTSADAGTLYRASTFSCPVQTNLLSGDIIELRTAVSVGDRVLIVDETSRLKFVPLHVINGASNTSTTPGSSLNITTTVPDTFVYGSLLVGGPSSDTITDDTGNDMTPIVRAGTANLTVNGAYKAASTTGLKRWQPVLGTSRTWIEILAAYEAGTPTVTTPTPATARHISTVMQETSTTPGLTWALTLPEDANVIPVGHTLILPVGHDYTAASATVTDTRGNTWIADRSSPVTGNVGRQTIFSCAVLTAIQPGDTITFTWTVSVTTKTATLMQFAGVAIPLVVDAQNGISGATGSPSTSLTPVTADTLLVASTLMCGPSNASYIPDVGWVSVPAVGGTSSGSAERTLYPSYKTVTATTAATYSPDLAGTYAFASLLVGYRAGTAVITPPPTGTGQFVRTLVTGFSSTPGAVLTLTVPSGGVPLGDTPVISIHADHTSSAPTVTDTKGNEWFLARTGTDGSGTNSRIAMYVGRITTALVNGDTITSSWSTSVTRRAAIVDQYSGVLVPHAVDNSNGRTGTSSSPTVPLTTVHPNTMVLTAVGVNGPSSITYAEAANSSWSSAGFAGTSDANNTSDKSLATSYRSVGTAGQYVHVPSLSTSAPWVSLIVAFRNA